MTTSSVRVTSAGRCDGGRHGAKSSSCLQALLIGACAPNAGSRRCALASWPTVDEAAAAAAAADGRTDGREVGKLTFWNWTPLGSGRRDFSVVTLRATRACHRMTPEIDRRELGGPPTLLICFHRNQDVLSTALLMQSSARVSTSSNTTSCNRLTTDRNSNSLHALVDQLRAETFLVLRNSTTPQTHEND